MKTGTATDSRISIAGKEFKIEGTRTGRWRSSDSHDLCHRCRRDRDHLLCMRCPRYNRRNWLESLEVGIYASVGGLLALVVIFYGIGIK